MTEEEKKVEADGGGEKSVFALFLVWLKCQEFEGKLQFGGILQRQQQVLACCQTHSDYGPSKMPLKLAW